MICGRLESMRPTPIKVFEVPVSVLRLHNLNHSQVTKSSLVPMLSLRNILIYVLMSLHVRYSMIDCIQ